MPIYLDWKAEGELMAMPPAAGGGDQVCHLRWATTAPILRVKIDPALCLVPGPRASVKGCRGRRPPRRRLLGLSGASCGGQHCTRSTFSLAFCFSTATCGLGSAALCTLLALPTCWTGAHTAAPLLEREDENRLPLPSSSLKVF